MELKNKNVLYNNLLINRLILYICKHGKKFKAEHIMYQTIQYLKKLNNYSFNFILHKSFINIIPNIEKQKLFTTNYLVKTQLISIRNTKRRFLLGFKLLNSILKNNKKIKYSEKFAIELNKLFYKQSESYILSQNTTKTLLKDLTKKHFRWNN